jgi:hypothetical protein
MCVCLFFADVLCAHYGFEQIGWVNASEVFQLETRRILESDGGVITLAKERMVSDISCVSVRHETATRCTVKRIEDEAGRLSACP